MNVTSAPIALFAYNRPEHLRRCLDALSKALLAQHSDVFIFIDGPKSASGIEAATAVHQVALSSSDSFRSLTITRRDQNMGLAANIIDGVTLLANQRGRVIVIEDDLVIASGFLEYMNWFLNYFESEQSVGSIHGYCYRGLGGEPSLFFMKGGDCWGWATWKDRWNLFELTLGFAAPYCRLLCAQILGKNNSWAIRWHASLFLHNRLTLYPTTSLVQNIGLDGSGENCGDIRTYDTDIVAQDLTLPKTLPPLLPSIRAREHFVMVFSRGRTGLYRFIWRGLGMISDLHWILRVSISR
jgi:hypothetical protein